MNGKSKRIALIQDAMSQLILSDNLVALQQLSFIDSHRSTLCEMCASDEYELKALINDLQIAYSEVQRVRESLFRGLFLTYLDLQESDVVPTRGPSTAFITKGS